MKATLTRQYLKSFLILFLLVSTGSFAQTPLNTFFTQEEVNIWKQRAANGPYKTLGDAQANSPGDWTRILNNANAFISNPLAERWKGVITNTCVQVGADEPALSGKKLRDAAFVYLITGDVKYANAVRNELLGQIKEPYTDFSVRTRWCDGVLRDAPPAYPICDWLMRLYFAYNYIKPMLTESERNQIVAWFYKGAVYFQRNMDADLGKLYVNRNAGDWTMSNYGKLMNSSLGRTTHFNGYKTASLGRYYNNRRGSQILFFTLFGIDQNIASMKNSGKLFIKEALMFGTYPDGTFAEFQRWREDFADIGISYSFLTISQMLSMADYFARTGDFEMYNFTTSRGLYGTAGGNKNLLLLTKTMLNHMDGTIKRYGTEYSTKIGTTAALIDGNNTESGRKWFTVCDIWFSQPNIYYKNTYIKDAYTRKGAGTRPYPVPGSDANVGMHRAWGGPWDVYPGFLFMYGQMEGKVWPYPGSVVNPSLSIAVNAQAAKCYGGSEGSASVSVSGGVAPYTYLWSNGATTAAVSGLKAGEYSVVVTDKNGVKQSKSLIVTQPLAITITKAIINETATAKGSISLTVSGGTTPYSYKWSTGATTKDISGLVAGTYTVTVTDANTCSVSQSITMSRLISPLALTLTGKSVTCSGSTNGSAIATVVGGVSPYSYAWSNGATTSAITGLKAGEYTVTVTDQAGVKTSKTVSIAQPASTAISHTAVDETATAKGSISLSVSGGTTPYSYKWSTGATTKDLTGVSAGNYLVTVTDANNCIVSKSIIINSIVPSLSIAVSSQAAKCYGGSEGSASVSVSGGVAPYTYLWSNGATTSAVSGLKAGEYTVTVSDKAGVKTSKSVSITQPAAIAIRETIVDETAFSKGSINLSISGGTAPYKYKWSNGAISKDVSGLIADTYTITVTDANNCIVSKSIEIEKSSPVSMAVLSLSLMNAENDEAITGYSTLKDGDTLELAALPTRKLNIRANTTDPNKIMKVRFGLNENPEHRIDRFSPYSLDGDFRGDFDAWKLTTGTYNVVVSPYDSSHVKGTELKLTFHIVEKKSTPLAIHIFAKQNTCNGSGYGSATATVTGGTAPYTYLWSNGATTSAVSGLKAGEYTVVVTDKNGAKVSKSVSITQPSSIAISETVVAQTAAAKGSISLSVSGGTAPYKYKWSNGVAAKDLTGIVAGSYSVTVTDASNCAVSKTIVVENELVAQVAVKSLSLVNADTKTHITGYDPLRNGDTLDLTTLPTRNLNIIANTTDPKNILKVKFKLNSNENYRTERNSPYLLEGNNGKSYHALKLKPGKYTVTAIAYNKGHKNGKSVTITFHIVEGKKQPLAIAINGSNVGCSGAKGSATATVSGGVSPYSYKWSTGATTKEVSGLKAGEYTVVVTDKNGAKVSKSISITQPSSIVISETVVAQTAAAKGSISLGVSGGTAPYKYKWSTGATTKDLTGVSAGSYTVTITDANNCSVSETFNVQSQAVFAINLTSTGVTCHGSGNGSATVSVSGGVSPYSYKWSTGATSASVSGLKAGEYMVTVSDKNGAKVSKSISITQPSAITISETVVAQTAAAKGSISLSVSGGTAPYKYKWSTGATTKDLTGIVAGSYSVTVTDANNCSSSKTIVVEKAQAQVAVVSLSLINADTDKVISAYATLKDGDVLELATLPTRKLSIQANTSEPKYIKKVQFSVNQTVDYHRDYGTPYFIASNDGANVKPWNVTPGKYTLTATPYDNELAKGKAVTITFEIVERKNNPFVVQINTKNNLCYNAAQGSATVSVSGGVSPYSYKWSTGATSASVSGLKAGEYMVTVSDKNGAKVSKSISITQPSAITISETVVAQTAAAKGSISLGVSGGTAPYKYKWSAGATTKDLTGVSAGSYTVTITDANNCAITKKIEVRNSDIKGSEITPIVDCVLDNGDGTFTATFGYMNASIEKITLAAGSSNFFAPAPIKGDVPETFMPGKNTRAFTAVFKNGASLTWTIIGQDGTKKIAVASANTARCVDVEPATITLKPSYLFSPNDDGIDDLWVINNIEQHTDYEVIIFNRNGNKVFQAKPYTNNWDGRYQGVPLMAEAYYYVIRSATEGNIKTGTVTLIR